MVIRNFDLEPIFNALLAFDGTTDEAGKFHPHAFKNAGKLRFSLAKNLRLVKEAYQLVSETRMKIANSLKPSPDANELKGEQYAEFIRQFDIVLKQEIDLPLVKMEICESDICDNRISATRVIEPLIDILEIV